MLTVRTGTNCSIIKGLEDALGTAYPLKAGFSKAVCFDQNELLGFFYT